MTAGDRATPASKEWEHGPRPAGEGVPAPAAQAGPPRLTAALDAARRGFRVLPCWWPLPDHTCACFNGKACTSQGKHPIINGWQTSATTDPAQIRTWWARWPDANPGGFLPRMICPDIDDGLNAKGVVKHGEATIKELEARLGALPPTWEIITGAGRRPVYLTPSQFRFTDASPWKDVDIRADGYGLIILPGGLHYSGKEYAWSAEGDPDDVAISEFPVAWANVLAGYQAERAKPTVTPISGETIHATFPQKLFDALYANSEKFRVTWDGARPEFNGDQSKYDQSIAALMARAEASDADIIAVVRAGRLRANPDDVKADRADYYARTITTARNGAHAENPAPADTTACLPSRLIGVKNPSDGLMAAAVADALRDAGEHFAQDAGGRLYRFRDGAYRAGTEAFIGGSVKALAERWNRTAKFSERLITTTLAYLTADAPALWERPPFDVVNLTNGLLNVETLTLTPHTPKHLSPVQLPVIYDPSSTCPAWERYSAAWFPQDALGLAWEVPAWLMTPDTSIQKAVLLIGESGNGKSRYLTGCANFLGRPNVSARSLQRLSTDRFAIASLYGKLANVCADLPSDHLTSSDVFKQLTGGEFAMTGERKFHDAFDFSPFARLVFSANHPPKSNDASEAFFSRWLVCLFPNSFRGAPGEVASNEIDDALSTPAELSGLLNRALAALPHIRTAHRLTESASMIEAFEDFRAATDPLNVWITANTIGGGEMVVPQKVLATEYRKFATANNLPPATSNAITKTIQRVYPRAVLAQRVVASEKVWAWLGLGLTAGGAQ